MILSFTERTAPTASRCCSTHQAGVHDERIFRAGHACGTLCGRTSDYQKLTRLGEVLPERLPMLPGFFDAPCVWSLLASELKHNTT